MKRYNIKKNDDGFELMLNYQLVISILQMSNNKTG